MIGLKIKINNTGIIRGELPNIEIAKQFLPGNSTWGLWMGWAKWLVKEEIRKNKKKYTR